LYNEVQFMCTRKAHQMPDQRSNKIQFSSSCSLAAIRRFFLVYIVLYFNVLGHTRSWIALI